MKKTKILGLAIIGLLFTQPVYGVLPPLYQSLAELKAIINSPEIGQKLPSSQPIRTIQRVDNGYLLLTDEMQVSVDVNLIPSTRPGPAQFNLHFHEAKKIN